MPLRVRELQNAAPSYLCSQLTKRSENLLEWSKSALPYKFLKIMVKSRVADIHAVCSKYFSLTGSCEGSYSKCHGNAVVCHAVNDCAMERTAALQIGRAHV